MQKNVRSLSAGKLLIAKVVFRSRSFGSDIDARTISLDAWFKLQISFCFSPILLCFRADMNVYNIVIENIPIQLPLTDRSNYRKIRVGKWVN